MFRLAGIIFIMLMSFNAHATNPGESAENCVEVSANDSGDKITFKNICHEKIFVLWCGASDCGGGLKKVGGAGFYTEFINLDADARSELHGRADEVHYAACKGALTVGKPKDYTDDADGGFNCTSTEAKKPEPAQVKKTNGELKLTITTNEAELAAKAKAEKKFAQEQKDQAKAQEIADRAEKKAEAEKRAAAEAKRKAQFQIVTAKNSDYQLEKHQTEKWCKESEERLRKSFSTGRNQLISVGVCRCTPPKEALMSYGCEYSYTYKEFESSSK